MRSRFLLAMVALAAIALFVSVAALQNRSGFNGAGNRLPIAASFYPLAEFARQVGQEKAEVRNLTPPGAEPHEFEPSPRDLAALQQSKVFVYNGVGFEPWVEKVLPDLAGQGLVLVDSSQGIRLLEASGESGQDQPRREAAVDPHFWLDPVLAKLQVENIKSGFITADPANAAFYDANALAYQARLDELDRQFREGLSACRRADVIASHGAFQYLARRYNLNVVAISGLSPEEEPSPRRLAEIADFARANNVKHIFFETLVSPRLAQTIATEVGAETLVFNPLEGLTSDEQAAGKDYLSVQRENLENLRTALECR